MDNRQRINESFSTLPEQIQNLMLCLVCQYPYNTTTRAPYIICQQCHHICLQCKQRFLRKQKKCHSCRAEIHPQNVFLDRNLKRTIQRQIQRIEHGQNIFLDIQSVPSSIIISWQPINPPPIFPQPVRSSIIIPDNNINQPLIQRDINQPINNANIVRDKQLSEHINFSIIFETPFMICNLIYYYNCDQTISIDKDYGVGMTIRDWLVSSGYFGLAIHFYALQIYYLLYCTKVSNLTIKVFYIVFLIIMFLKLTGYDLILVILWAHVDSSDAKDLDMSIYSYITSFVIMYCLFKGLSGIAQICILIQKF